MKAETLKPIVKWAGGKGQLLNDISMRYPAGFGSSIKRYAEPFVGGGAVLFDILSKYQLDEVYINDCNAELINMYRQVRDNVSEVVNGLQWLQEQYSNSSETGRRELFYEKRTRYNELIQSGKSIDSVESAVLFIFLNRTCFNGLYRVNSKGLFNVPSGTYKNPLICDRGNLLAVSKALHNVIIACGDYHESEMFVDNHTFVYFDPPYRPLTSTANFTSYTENVFDDNAQIELAHYAINLSKKGAYVLLSNSDPKNADPNDSFFDNLYSELHISRVCASRMINSNGNARGKISELLIASYEHFISDNNLSDAKLSEYEVMAYEKI